MLLSGLSAISAWKMPVIKQYPTLTELWHGTIRRMWRGTLDNGGLDYVASADTIAYDNLLAAKSMDFSFDLGRDLWLTKHRWSVLVRQYLDPLETERFLSKAAEIAVPKSKNGKRGVVSSMFARNVAREAKKHRWGNCMGSFTFRGTPGTGSKHGPTLAIHSRVTYIAYIGGLDLALAAVLAREIASEHDLDPTTFRFRWYVDALQFHGFKSLPMLFRTEYIEDLERAKLRQRYPTINLVGRWYDALKRYEADGKPLQAEKYGPLKRVRRRYEEYQSGDYLPSVTLDDLNLDPLWRR